MPVPAKPKPITAILVGLSSKLTTAKVKTALEALSTLKDSLDDASDAIDFVVDELESWHDEDATTEDKVETAERVETSSTELLELIRELTTIL